MKKILMALAVLALVATSGFGAVGVDINWTTVWGIYTDTATDLSGASDYILDSYAITWQLIYSVNNTAEAPDASNGANGYVGTGVGADDTVWATRTFALGDGSASDGTEWDTAVYYVSGDTHYLDTGWALGDVGYIYQRVFQDTPAIGSWYFDSAPEALDADPTTYQDSVIDVSGGGTAGIQPDQQVPSGAVPEPATMSLLGLGALAMAFRRRRS